jgi:hypothetical protein
MKINLSSYVKSITSEVDVTKNRVRDLIGDLNWNEEGRYKESILRRILSNHLPNKYEVGTGFILRQDRNGELIVSKQIDIIVYDNTRPVLFKEGNFVILNDFLVRGIIEVKTRFYKEKFESEFQKCCDNSYFVAGDSTSRYRGLFYFEFDQKFFHETVDFFNNLPLHWNNHIDVCLGKDHYVDRYGGKFSFKIQENLAYSFFIIQALERICGFDYQGREMIDLEKISQECEHEIERKGF